MHVDEDGFDLNALCTINHVDIWQNQYNIVKLKNKIKKKIYQVVWYSHLFQNFPQFIVIHTVKGFCIVNKAEIDVFLELSCFFR